MDGSKAFTALVQQRALTVASIRLVQNIKETAVYNQVRTVVWEDGAARPLLPDRFVGRSCLGNAGRLPSRDREGAVRQRVAAHTAPLRCASVFSMSWRNASSPS